MSETIDMRLLAFNKGMGRPRARNRTCMHCGGTHCDYRVRTRDLRCKECRGITPVVRD